MDSDWIVTHGIVAMAEFVTRFPRYVVVGQRPRHEREHPIQSLLFKSLAGLFDHELFNELLIVFPSF